MSTATYQDEDYIPVQGTGKNLETVRLTNENGDTVHREGVFIGSLLDGGNTTTTLLGAGETFTGEWEHFPDGAQVSCKSDVAGTLYFDFSNDSTNIDTFPVNGFLVSAGVHEYHNAKVGGRFFRVRFINGSSEQSYFRLYSYQTPYGIGNSPLNQTQSLDSDALLVRVGSDPDIEYVSGKISGYTIVHKFGRNSAVSTSFVPVSIGGIYRTPQTGSATQVRIKAGDANDAAGGSGARSVFIQGINASGDLTEETLATNGASAGTASTNSYIRLFRAYVASSGTYATQSSGSHAADIVIENAAGTEDWLTIPNGDFPRGQTEVGIYTIPNGYTGYIREITLSVDSGKTATVALFQRQNILETAAPYSGMRVVNTYDGVSGSYPIPLKSPLGPFPENTDIGFMAKVAATTASVTVNYEILLIET